MGPDSVLTRLTMRIHHVHKAEAAVDETLVQEVTDLLSALGNRFVAYYPNLAALTGSPKAALMLGHAMFMTRVVMDKQPGRQGWFWKTSTEWKQVSGLSVRELETARRTLLKLGILSEERRGMPAKLWYRVDLDNLSRRLCEYANTAYRPWSWEDRVLKTLLGKPVMFYAPFAWIADSALAGLYASSLFGRLRQAVGQHEVTDGGWFSSPVVDGMTRLQFGRRMLMNARARLVEAGMMEEARENRMQSTILTRLKLAGLIEKIGLQANEFHSLQDPANKNAGSCKQELLKTRNKSCPNRETRVAVSADQELPEPQINSCSNRESCSAVSAPFSNKEINTPYQPLHKGGVGVEKGFAHRHRSSNQPNPDNLFFPDKLLPEEKQAALAILAGSPNPQTLLDELAGQMADGHVATPLAYLRGLRKKQLAGEFQQERAYRIAADRHSRQEILKQRESLMRSPVPVDRMSPEQARHSLSELRQRLWGKS